MMTRTKPVLTGETFVAMTSEFEQAEPSRADINALKGTLILEFGAPWCGHCQAAQPLLAKVFAAHPQLRHMKIEDGPGRPLGRSFRVKLWPTLVFMKGGVEVARLVRPADTAAIIDALALLADARS